MIFQKGQQLELAYRFSQPICVHSVEPWHVDDLQAEPALCQDLGRQQCFVEHHGTIGKENCILAFYQGHAVAWRQLIILWDLNFARRWPYDQTNHTVLGCLIHTVLHHHARFSGIEWLENDAIGQCAEQ